MAGVSGGSGNKNISCTDLSQSVGTVCDKKFPTKDYLDPQNLTYVF